MCFYVCVMRMGTKAADMRQHKLNFLPLRCVWFDNVCWKQGMCDADGNKSTHTHTQTHTQKHTNFLPLQCVDGWIMCVVSNVGTDGKKSTRAHTHTNCLSLQSVDVRESVCRDLGVHDGDGNRSSPLLLEVIRRSRHREKSFPTTNEVHTHTHTHTHKHIYTHKQYKHTHTHKQYEHTHTL